MSDELLDEYLWDRSGGADDFVRRLEQLLVRYRYDRPFSLVEDESESVNDNAEEPSG